MSRGDGGGGRFISLEGGEGAGKSTQGAALADWLRARAGVEVVLTREPGGTGNGEAVRGLLLEGAADRWSPAAELLLVNAARVDHVERVVRPALARGAWVLCDRYVDSTRVYQGLAGGIGLAAVDRLHGEILGLPWPDLTLLLDLEAEAGLARRAAAGAATRFEGKGGGFHRAVVEGFRGLAAAEPARIAVVDAAGPSQGVQALLREAVLARFLGLASDP